MGNHKFKLSSMIPNAWLYKLKQMGTNTSSRNHHPTELKRPLTPLPTIIITAKPDHAPEESDHTSLTPPPLRPHHHSFQSHPRKSYHFARNLSSKTPKSSDSTDFFYPPIDPPRKSSRRRRATTKKRTNSTHTSSPTPTTKYSSSSSVSTGCSCRATATATVHSYRTKPVSSPQQESFSSSTTTSSSLDHVSLLTEFSLDQALPSKSFDRMVALSSASCHCRPNSPTTEDDNNDVVIGVDKMSLSRKTGETVSRIGLPPIRTEHKKFSDLVKEISGTQKEVIDEPIKQRRSSAKYRDSGGNGSIAVKVVKEESMVSSVLKEHGSSPVRKVLNGSPRVRIRINSPRLSRRVVGNAGRKSVSRSSWRKSVSSESLAVVKSSSDPQRDFRESMVEMIVENNINASKDLEELLACYLSLNSSEYHHVIIQAFKQIWFDLNNVRKGKAEGF